MKQQEIHFLWTDTLRQNSRTMKWEGGPTRPHIPSFSSQATAQPQGGERLLGGQRGVMPRMLYPQASWLKFTLAKRGADTWGDPEIYKIEP